MIHSDLMWVFEGCGIDLTQTEDKSNPRVIVRAVVNQDLLEALKAIQSIAKDPDHRTQRTLLQTCRFFDELILPTIEPAITQAKGDE